MELTKLIKLALQEDVRDGDHSSLACIPKNAQRKAKLLIKEKGILAGLNIAKAVFLQVDKNLELEFLLKDGDAVNYGDIAFYVSGSSQSILKAERLVLNLMQRMSGIATITNQVVEKIKNHSTKVLDTRKTTPLLRAIEKEAVRIGGGTNHRFGLYDMIMLKDNHIDYAGGIQNAIEKTNNYLKTNDLNLKIEIEVRDLKELDEVLAIGKVDRIMLDNFNYEDLKTAVQKINKQYETEASGGITLETAEAYAACGVDFISMGALTHSVKSLDMSLKAFLRF